MIKKMSNPNYVKGRNFEYKVAAWFRRRGYVVQRSAGSQTISDLVALKKNQTPLSIQCKKGNATMSREDKNRFFLSAQQGGSIPILVSAEDRKPMIFTRITGLSINDEKNEIVVPGAKF